MERLAFIEIVDTRGKDRKIPACDIADVTQTQAGAEILMRDGRIIEATTTADAIYTAIDTMWTEFTTALGNP